MSFVVVVLLIYRTWRVDGVPHAEEIVFPVLVCDSTLGGYIFSRGAASSTPAISSQLEVLC